MPEDSEPVVPRLAIVRTVAGIASAALGFYLCFSVHLSRFMSHGSAWGSQSLQTQWYIGRGLTLAGGLALIASVVRAIETDALSRQEIRWIILAAVGLVGIMLDLAINGLML